MRTCEKDQFVYFRKWHMGVAVDQLELRVVYFWWSMMILLALFWKCFVSLCFIINLSDIWELFRFPVMNLHPRLNCFCELGCKKVLFLIVKREDNEANDKEDISEHGISNFPNFCSLAPMER